MNEDNSEVPPFDWSSMASQITDQQFEESKIIFQAAAKQMWFMYACLKEQGFSDAQSIDLTKAVMRLGGSG